MCHAPAHAANVMTLRELKVHRWRRPWDLLKDISLWRCDLASPMETAVALVYLGETEH